MLAGLERLQGELFGNGGASHQLDDYVYLRVSYHLPGVVHEHTVWQLDAAVAVQVLVSHVL